MNLTMQPCTAVFVADNSPISILAVLSITTSAFATFIPVTQLLIMSALSYLWTNHKCVVHILITVK